MQQTPQFISSLVVKMVIDETSLLLGHDSSEHLPSLDCMCDQLDSDTLQILVDIGVYKLMMAGFQNHKTTQYTGM
jgi:hypothetical protein